MAICGSVVTDCILSRDNFCHRGAMLLFLPCTVWWELVIGLWQNRENAEPDQLPIQAEWLSFTHGVINAVTPLDQHSIHVSVFPFVYMPTSQSHKWKRLISKTFSFAFMYCWKFNLYLKRIKISSTWGIEKENCPAIQLGTCWKCHILSGGDLLLLNLYYYLK
jgi:hypothetical protein